MKAKSVWFCKECGNESPKWMGRCPACGEWNTMVEETVVTGKKTAAQSVSVPGASHKPMALSEIDSSHEQRISLNNAEVDRILGGGLVEGSLVLIGGEPGIGKSTLSLQIPLHCPDLKTLYVTGEESAKQVKLRAARIGGDDSGCLIYSETLMENIIKEAREIMPDLMVVDSVQTMYSDRVPSAPGSITNVKEVAMAFIAKAKSEGISVILVGHVNKEGGIAGPKVLEHMVDAVLNFEGDKRQSYRIIRANKNRFGSTNEIGVFEMTDKGLREVPNPSEMLLADRPLNTVGNCAVCTVEGTRPLVAEIQALVTPTSFPTPRRTSNGIDYNRTYLILAVLEKRLGLKFSANDVYLNVIGGVRIDEPASDLGIALALISSLTDRPIPDDLIAIGELGLSGEIRGVANIEGRIREAARLGFTTAVVPPHNLQGCQHISGIKVLAAKNVYDILKFLKPKAE